MSALPEDVGTVLVEFGAAIRGDWGSIDGRGIQYGMELFVVAMSGPADRFVDEARNALGLCPGGGGHWTSYCGEEFFSCAPRDGAG